MSKEPLSREEQFKYLQVMNEIKNRIILMNGYWGKNSRAMYIVDQIELSCLQIRKILELIALGSLVVNQKLFNESLKKLKTYWNAKNIIRDIERLNPLFYPQAVTYSKSKIQGVSAEYLDKQEHLILTKKEFIKVYEKCGIVMHASNPLKGDYDTEYYKKNIKVWLGKIIQLLDKHKISFVNNNYMYLIQLGRLEDQTTITPFIKTK